MVNRSSIIPKLGLDALLSMESSCECEPSLTRFTSFTINFLIVSDQHHSKLTFHFHFSTFF